MISYNTIQYNTIQYNIRSFFIAIDNWSSAYYIRRVNFFSQIFNYLRIINPSNLYSPFIIYCYCSSNRYFLLFLMIIILYYIIHIIYVYIDLFYLSLFVYSSSECWIEKLLCSSGCFCMYLSVFCSFCRHIIITPINLLVFVMPNPK